MPLNKLVSTITSSESFGIGAIWISSATSMADTPNRSNGEVGLD